MKEKTITIKTNEISQRQYSTLLLELNIMKRQWKSYGVDIQLSAPSLKKIIALGTSNGTDNLKRRTVSTNSSYKTDVRWNSINRRD